MTVPAFSRIVEQLAALLHGGYVREGIGVVFCIIWALAALGLGLALRRIWRVPAWICRKVIVMGVGLWIVVAFFWIQLWPAGWLPPLAFLLINYVVYDKGWLPNLRRDGEKKIRHVLGYQLSPLILMLLLWWSGDQFMVIAGIMALTFGDSAAGVAGRVWGKNHFRFRGGEHKTLEGALAMFAVSLVAIMVTTCLFARMPGVWFLPWCLIGALLAAMVATVAELYAPRRWEDFLVPLLTGLTMYYYTVAGFR